MTHWFEQLKVVEGKKYSDQMAFLREKHGFSQAHANTLVQYSRGSTSTRKYESVDQYLAQFDETKTKTVSAILEAVTSEFPKMEVVIAWNHPMLRQDGTYYLGVSVHKNHVLVAPFSSELLEVFAPRLMSFDVNKKSFKVPVDWKVDSQLLRDMVTAQLTGANK